MGAELDIDLLQSTYQIIKKNPEKFVTSFYDILFDKYPKIQPLFAKTEMREQKYKLIISLDLVLVNVRTPSVFTSVLRDLGKRHVKYGAVLTDYPLIGDALLQALELHLGEHWNPAVQEVWTLAYQMIADTMAEGARMAIEKDSPEQQEAKSNNSSANGFLITVSIVSIVACGYLAGNFLQSQLNDSNPARVSNPAK